MLPPVLLSAVMCGAVYGVSLLAMPELVSLILQIVCGIAVYLGLAVLLKLESFNYLWTAMRKYFTKNRAPQPPVCAEDGSCGDDVNKII
jgi:hypothetical protein